MKRILILCFLLIAVTANAANTVPRLWERINYLVPGPQCQTFAEDYDTIIWKDSRPMPTVGEVWSVKEKDMDDAKKDKDKDAKLTDDLTNALIEVMADLHVLTVSEMKQLVKDKLK